MKKFYTRTGDDGYTGLLGKDRVPKYHPRPATNGEIDEATAALGLARATTTSDDIKNTLLHIQRDLYELMAEVASTIENAANFRSISQQHVMFIESKIDDFSKSTVIPKEFIIPGDNQSSATLSLARAIIRRAERSIVKLYHEGEIENQYILQYLNRLSSLLFVMELYEIERTSHDQPTLAKDQSPS